MEPIQHGNLEHGHYDLGFPGGSVEKNLPANEGDAGDAGLIAGSGRSPEEKIGNPLHNLKCPYILITPYNQVF